MNTVSITVSCTTFLIHTQFIFHFSFLKFNWALKRSWYENFRAEHQMQLHLHLISLIKYNTANTNNTKLTASMTYLTHFASASVMYQKQNPDSKIYRCIMVYNVYNGVHMTTGTGQKQHVSIL